MKITIRHGRKDRTLTFKSEEEPAYQLRRTRYTTKVKSAQIVLWHYPDIAANDTWWVSVCMDKQMIDYHTKYTSAEAAVTAVFQDMKVRATTMEREAKQAYNRAHKTASKLRSTFK